jgi:hypothetical protein
LKSIRSKIDVKDKKGDTYSKALLDLVPIKYKTQKCRLDEPYYKYFFKLIKNCKWMFMDNFAHGCELDKITTAVYFDSELLLYHTWYSRYYCVPRSNIIEDFDNFNRINKVIQKVCELRNMDSSKFI